MKQRRHLKKLMAVPLALVLLVGMALPILAETDDPPSDAGFALASEGTDGAPSPDGSPEDGSNTEGSGTPDDPQSEELPQSSSVGEDDSTPESDSSLEAEDDSELEDDSDASLADADLMLMSLGALVEGVDCGSFTITATGSGMGINPVGNATFSNVGLAVNTGAGVGFSAATTGAQLGFTGGSVTFGTGGDCFSISASGSTLAFDSLPVRLVGGSCINHSAVGSAVVRFTGCPSVSLAATGGDGVKMSGNGAASLIFDRPGRLEISASGICVNATGYTKTISFLSPGRAILSAGGAGVVGVYGTGTYATKVNITTGALNRWNSPTLVANPTNIWNLASGGSMVLTGSGTGNAGALTIDTAQSTLPVMGTDPIAEALTTSTLNLTGTKLMVLGELGLTVDTVYDQSPAITGKTAAGAAVSAAFTDGVSAGVSGSAGGDGAYAMDILAFEPDVGTAVTVTARYDELSVRRQTVVRDASAFTLSIEVPQTITYGTVAVSTREQWV